MFLCSAKIGIRDKTISCKNLFPRPIRPSLCVNRDPRTEVASETRTFSEMLRLAAIVACVASATAFAPCAMTARCVVDASPRRVCRRRPPPGARRRSRCTMPAPPSCPVLTSDCRVQADAAQGHLHHGPGSPPGCGPPRGNADGHSGSAGAGQALILDAVPVGL